jgi:hypothetical protein
MPRVIVGNGDIGVYSTGRVVKEAVNAQYVINVEGLRDPLSNRGFRFSKEDGRDREVMSFVEDDPRVSAIRDEVLLLAHLNFKAPGQTSAWISFLFKDVHGKWIAPAVAELIADSLIAANYKVSVHHWGLGGKK